MLKVRDLSIHYTRTEAVVGANVNVRDGEIVALLGANGAGKSSLLKGITGLEPNSGGSVDFCDSDVTRLQPHERILLGMALVLEGRGIFGELTVRENLDLGAYLRRSWAMRKEVAADLDLVLNLFPRLAERSNQIAGTLSGGEQQMLAIGRAIMTAPKLLILDEPFLGLSPRIVGEVVNMLRVLHRERQLAILVAEQNAVLGLDLADRSYVLHRGRIVIEGTAKSLADQAGLIDFYFGRALTDKTS